MQYAKQFILRPVSTVLVPVFGFGLTATLALALTVVSSAAHADGLSDLKAALALARTDAIKSGGRGEDLESTG